MKISIVSKILNLCFKEKSIYKLNKPLQMKYEAETASKRNSSSKR